MIVGEVAKLQNAQVGKYKVKGEQKLQVKRGGYAEKFRINRSVSSQVSQQEC